jgi:hypothetical protein
VLEDAPGAEHDGHVVGAQVRWGKGMHRVAPRLEKEPGSLIEPPGGSGTAELG